MKPLLLAAMLAAAAPARAADECADLSALIDAVTAAWTALAGIGDECAGDGTSETCRLAAEAAAAIGTPEVGAGLSRMVLLGMRACL